MANTGLKSSFCAVNFLYVATAVCLVAGGIWFSLKVKEITDLRNYERYQLDLNIYWPQVIPYIFIAIALLVLIVTCCGLCGAFANSKGALITYNIFSVIVFFLLIGAGVTAILIANNNSENFIKETIHNVFEEVKVKPHVAEKFGLFESRLHCCGADGPRNYNTAGLSLPKSCCTEGFDCTNYLNQRKGCIEVATVYTQIAFLIGTILCGLVAFLCLVSMLIALGLISNLGSKIST